MDHSWRPRPMQGNICPMCSISHWPFCPPHPGFHQNPRFPEHNDHFFPRPHFDPFSDHRGPPAGLRPPFIGNSGDRFGDPRTWQGNPSLEREPFGHFPRQSHMGNPGVESGYHADGFAPSRYDHRGVGFKRMRVDETGSGSFTNDNYMHFTSKFEEDERRLKLIREHGGVNDKSRAEFESGEHGKHHSFRARADDMPLKPPSNVGVDSFQDLDFSATDRKETFSNPDSGFKLQKYNEDHDLATAPLYSHSNRRGDFGQLNYENSLSPSLQSNGPKGLPVRGSQISELGDGVVDFYREGGARYNNMNGGDGYSSTLPKGDLRQQPHMSHYHSEPYPNLDPFDSSSLKKTQHPHSNDWRGLSGSRSPNYERRSDLPLENHYLNDHYSQPYMQSKYDIRSSGGVHDRRQLSEANILSHDREQALTSHTNYSAEPHYGSLRLNKQISIPAANNVFSEDMGPLESYRASNFQPPLPTSPPPPLPVDLPRHPLSEPHASFLPHTTSPSLFPIPLSSPATLSATRPPVPDRSPAQPSGISHLHVSAGFVNEESRSIQRISSKKLLGEDRCISSTHVSSDKPKVVDASHIFKQPHRAHRPDRIVIILRGLPGSGKSYLAKMLRDLEVENGGGAPRIHSMDDYFMTEVEKVEEHEVSKSSAYGRGKKSVVKKVMEYCYESDMEEAYRSSMLKAFKKTLEEGVFSFIIVDDRNLRVADFAQFWATAKRSGYEVYLLEASYKDPAGCAARNVHGFTQEDIERMAGQWEEAPSLYLKLDIKPLLHGDDMKESRIQEVDMDMDMDMDDGGSDVGLSGSEERNPGKPVPPVGEDELVGSLKDDKGWDSEPDHPPEAKELGRSKWSADFDEDDMQKANAYKGKSTSLSNLLQAYAKEGKSVHWGDQAGSTGFSIGAAKKANMLSLVIGPGAGYNLKSNPLSEDVKVTTQSSSDSKERSAFQEQLRAERESFKAVFDKRRQRIGGLAVEDE